jgi:rod shape-determining protein MreD
MKRGMMYLIAGLVALFLQTTVLSHLPVKPDLVLILVVCMGLSQEAFSGLVLAFMLGCLTDVFAGSTPGFFALTKTLVFLLAYIARGRLFFDDTLARAGLVLIAALMEVSIFVFLVKLRSVTAIPLTAMGRLALGSVLLTTLAALFCFPVFKRTGIVLREQEER